MNLPAVSRAFTRRYALLTPQPPGNCGPIQLLGGPYLEPRMKLRMAEGLIFVVARGVHT